MKKASILLALALSLSACGPALFATVKPAPSKSAEQVKLDEIQCGQASQTQGPWLFGIGYAIYKSMAADRYKKCMEDNGHVVERSN